MQTVRIQSLSRVIGANSRAFPSLEKRSRSRSVKIKQSGSFAFDLTTMKDVQKNKKLGLLAKIESLFSPDEKEETKLPSLEEFMCPNPKGKFPLDPIITPFPNPLAKKKFKSSMLLQTSQNPDEPAEKISDPVLKKLQLMFCLKGKLLKSDKGLYYIKLPEQIIGTLLPFLKKQKATPPKHLSLIDHLGAHIPIISPDEKFDFGIPPSQVGETFYFALTGLYSKKVNNYEGASKIWYVSFVSYDLEKLRKKHGLTNALGGESFHCVIATTPQPNQTKVQETFRISPLANSA